MNRLLNKKKYIVKGGLGSGKTAVVSRIVHIFKENGFYVCGVSSVRIVEGNRTVGYDIVDLKTGSTTVFLREKGDVPTKNMDVSVAGRIGKFFIYESGLQAGLNALDPANLVDCDVIVVDEVGRLELKGGGWADRLRDLERFPGRAVVFTVRDTFVHDVTAAWGCDRIFDVDQFSPGEIAAGIIEDISVDN